MASTRVFLMAAAYAFHIAEGQPFIDGNKRTGLNAALVFLELNGWSVDDPNKRLLQAADGDRFRFDAGSSPALFPHGGSAPIVPLLAFDAAAEAQDVRQTERQQMNVRSFS